MPSIHLETPAEFFCDTQLINFDATMLPPGAAHVACLALVALPSMPALQARSHTSPVCAFCSSCAISSCFSTSNWVRRRTRGLSNGGASTSSQVLSHSPLQYSPVLNEGGPFRRGEDPFIAAASRWDDKAGDDGNGDGGRGDARNRREAPWEDIQWSNVPAARKGSSSGGGRRRRRWEGEEEEEEEEEEEDLSLGEQGREYFRSGNDNNDRQADYYGGDEDGDGDGDYMADGGLQQQRRRRARAAAPEASEQRDVESSSPPWNAGWFRDAQQANQSSMFSWARSLYNALFWYGGASEDAEQLPAMNFQDLLERFDSIAGDDSPGKLRPIVPPEDLGAEQDYRWRPSALDSTAAPEGRGQRLGKPKGYSAGGEGGRRGARKERVREPARNDDREQWPASREPPLPRRREEANRGGWDRGGGRERREQEGARRRGGGGGGGGGGGEADAVAIGQLRRKQKQLADREHKLEGDLEKVRERLGVVDATVELWLRRSATMLSRGGSETDTEVLQAKRRIYGLKDEGRQLDSATVALGDRLEDCRAKLDRIVQKLELLGEDAVPLLLYEGDESVFATIEAEGERDERGDEKADFEAGVVQMDDLRLAAEEQNKEVLPAVGEAEK